MTEKQIHWKFLSAKIVACCLGVIVLAWGIHIVETHRHPHKNKVIPAAIKLQPTPKQQLKTAPVKDTTAYLDTNQYNAKLLYLVHGKPDKKWPVKTSYPMAGAILPFKRIVAYYGNFYNATMGVLGTLPTDTMLNHLQAEVKKWELTDPNTPVVPALHYIAVTAQHNGGKNDKYRLRMPFEQIDKALALAKSIDAVLFLDIQPGHSTPQDEIPPLEHYLSMPGVYLGIDPEFSMKNGNAPGTTIGTLDAADINYAIDYLADLVHKYNLPPKILVIHRFTKDMVTNYKQIKTRPEVQVVMNMDGWGFPAKKVNSYKLAIEKEPVQFTGFKLFYKNDLTEGQKKIMDDSDVLKLYPMPSYIQYQ